jgi:hypothetical protein
LKGSHVAPGLLAAQSALQKEKLVESLGKKARRLALLFYIPKGFFFAMLYVYLRSACLKLCTVA